MNYIIGSGPAGVSCASALLAAGKKVTMVDVGLQLEKEKEKDLEAYLRGEIDDISKKIDSGLLYNKEPIKTSYGSTYPYAALQAYFKVKMDKNIHCQFSFASGGLSTVWGAFIEKYDNKNMHDWPFQFDELDPFYEKIYSLFNEGNFHEKSDKIQTFTKSKQASLLYNHFKTNDVELKNAGVSFGEASLAVNFKKCIYCGLCQHGCPLKLIYTSNKNLEKLKLNSNFTYLSNIVITEIAEKENEVKIQGYLKNSNKKVEYNASRLFIGTGTIISTYLILNALSGRINKSIISDSTHFMLPCLLNKRVKNSYKENLHTLCQLYLKLDNKKISNMPINLQIYTYMDIYEKKIKKMLGWIYPLVRSLISFFLDRLLVIQGHIHSSESHKFILEIENDSSINLTSKINKNVNGIIQNVIRHLNQNRKILGFKPLKPLVKISKISRSFHFGCSMPMKTNPSGLESDTYGRPAGLSRIHVIDSSVLPSIAAGSITPTIMANAYRIGIKSIELESGRI